MPPKAPASKKAATKSAATSAARSAAKKAAIRAPPAQATKPKKAAAPKAPVASSAKVLKPKAAKAAAPAEKKGPVQKTRIVFPKDHYEPNKDAIKAPFKANGMKWNYLGEGKGLYKREKELHCFTQFMDDGVHYSLWGDDKAGVEKILAAWRKLVGEDAFAKFVAQGEKAGKAEEQEKESEAVRLWKLGEPQARPGEPDFFFKKRHDEWLAKRPAS